MPLLSLVVSLFILSKDIGLVSADCPAISNGGFERDHPGGPFTRLVPSGWNASGSVLLAANGNAPWGGLTSGSGSFYVVLQGAGSYIQRNITGLQPNMQYTLSFMTAERPGRPVEQRFTVSVNGQPLITNLYPFDQFTTHNAAFTTNAYGYAMVQFENTSPPGDASVFVDNVQLCSVPLCPVVDNGGFEADAHGGTHVVVSSVTGWALNSPTASSFIVAANGNIPWGGLNSGAGAYYMVIRGTGANIQQVMTGLVPGGTYTLSFLAAERPGYTSAEELTVVVNGNTLDQLNPYGYFERHAYTFNATTGGQATLRFVNTGPAGDQAVFVDDVRVCYMPPTTMTTQTTQTTSTATPTTHTIAQNNTREFRSIQRVQDVLVRDVSTLLSSMTAITQAQSQLVTRVAAIEGAVSSAVALLPPAGSLPSSPASCAAGDTSCQPSMQADTDGNVRIVAPAGTVELQSGTCGVVNPCTLMAALNQLRGGAGVAPP
eukprot:m.160445 g.160445  ORF g.160445 m.160445 type:complete len:488 (+) comp18025_c0_seq1:60-1523(+)